MVAASDGAMTFSRCSLARSVSPSTYSMTMYGSGTVAPPDSVVVSSPES